MDGNGRWGLKNKKTRNDGHKKGLKTAEEIIIETVKNNIKYLTLFVFSSDNWKRPNNEINFLFSLLEKFLKNKINLLNKHKIKIKFFGNKKINKKLNNLFNRCESETRFNNKIQVNLAINYGSRQEIVNAARNILKKKKIFNIKNLENNLYTKNIPDPDILIRTGNTKRLSNFFLWQLSYTEIFFEKKLWPDFNSNDYKKIINQYKKIKRNYGSV